MKKLLPFIFFFMCTCLFGITIQKNYELNKEVSLGVEKGVYKAVVLMSKEEKITSGIVWTFTSKRRFWISAFTPQDMKKFNDEAIQMLDMIENSENYDKFCKSGQTAYYDDKIHKLTMKSDGSTVSFELKEGSDTFELTQMQLKSLVSIFNETLDFAENSRIDFEKSISY